MEKRRLHFGCLLLSALLWAFTAAHAQDITITNLDQLAQVALSANYSIYLPFSPWDWRAYATDWPLWCDFTQMACLDSLPTSTNFTTGMDWSNVPVASEILTKNVFSGVTTVESADSTDVVATIAAPSGYQPYTNSADHWLWDWYVQATNNPDLWGLTPDQIPPPIVTLQTFLVDSNTYYSVYSSNIAAEVAAAAQASSTPTLAMGGGLVAMDDDEMDDGDPCVITNYSAPFSIVSIASDGSGDVVLQWQSCTNALYIVQSTSALPSTSWTDVAWMFGTDQQTSWTDTNAVGLTQNFYQVVRANPTNTNNGIPYGWAVTYGLDPLDPNLASEDPTGDGVDNLQKYEYGLDPTVSNAVDVVVNGGGTWATNQTITLDASGFPFPFIKVGFDPFMLNFTLSTNTGAPFTYLLPSATNATYYLYLQYADAQTNALGPVLLKRVTLDTIPPAVQIISPTNS